MGKAGAVRIFKDRVVLCMNASRGAIGYKGCIFSGFGPFERAVQLADLKPGDTKVNDACEKWWRSIDIGEGLTASGEGPFTAKLDGRARALPQAVAARRIHRGWARRRPTRTSS